MERFAGQTGWWRARVAVLMPAHALATAVPAVLTTAVTVFGALFSLTANAQVYKWVDANGVTHYSERPQNNAKARRDENCRRARAQLVNMRASGSFYRLNDAGERVFMSDAERDASLARREAEFKTNCE